ncbi:peptide/nickel transport system permease protein [Clostridium sp. DSM 8431]|uniref:oligopeptide ABC transporter permease n=1 Tax=Clostridium sp. DSM 8431 TaxID=1761781 RepID=UPI0008E03A69|nr:oligopeptide ABC transporter permease [Clostridium sp. DSM 8431]SFU62224.1 peptide/nickel transport system permease protein [Clostridium sp. DSM 8431]
MKKKDERNNEIVSPSKVVFNRLKKNKLAMFGLILIVAIVALCFIGPFFMKYDYNTQTNDLQVGFMVNGHILGTDKLGRDILTRLMYGGRISILVGVVSVAVEIIIGTLIGAIAGYYGGKVDTALMSLADVWMSLPFLPVIIILGSILSELQVPAKVRVIYLIFIMGVLSWGSIARLVRGEILSLREQEFMQATEALGLKDTRKILRHLIPNVIPILIVNATLGIGSFIITESALSYLGVGVTEPIPSWGNMINAANSQANIEKRPWLWVPPGVCILLITLGVNLFGDALRDALDPKKNR